MKQVKKTAENGGEMYKAAVPENRRERSYLDQGSRV